MSIEMKAPANPSERSRSSRHKLKIMLEAIPDEDLQAIVRKTMELARAGNVAAAALRPPATRRAGQVRHPAVANGR
jgi:hypothetical protein